MIRYALNEMKAWKDGIGRRPLIVRGARRVGKTWLMREFGRVCFKKVAYINFENNSRMAGLFEGEPDIDRLVAALQIEAGVRITAPDTLIIFDGAQEVPRALSSLQAFGESAPEFAVVAGAAPHVGASLAFGKVDYMDLYPMSFTEFLEATGNLNLAQLLRSNNLGLITALKAKYLELLKQYFYVGGMPEAVASFTREGDYDEVRRVHNSLLDTCEQDLLRRAPPETASRARMLWNSVPLQLARENKKFLYGMIREGARAKEFESAIQWLSGRGFISQVFRVTRPDIPLTFVRDFSAFKLFMADVGLLAAKYDLEPKTLLEGMRVFEEFSGALAQQYVHQQLLSDGRVNPYFWTAERAAAQVSFVFRLGPDIVPLEVMARENLKAKNLKSYREKYRPRFSARASLSDYRTDGTFINVPLYAAGCLPQLLQKQ